MTLTQTANLTRKGIIIIIVLMIVAISGSIGYNIWNQYRISQIPPVEEKPEMKFGLLPKIDFPASKVTSSNYSYSLDTVTGGLPQTPKFLKVYFIPKSSITLLAPEKSINLAKNLGFSNGPEILSTNMYKFTDDKGGSLIIDLATGNFNFQKSNETVATDSATLTLPDKEKLVTDFKNYLASNNLLIENIKNGRSEVQYDNGTAPNFTSALISLFPSDFESYPIVTALFNQSLIKVVAIPDQNQENYSKLDYTYWTIDQTTSSTYPLKTPQQAYDELKSGAGFVSIESKSPRVSISSVYLAYLESAEYSPYLQPVFVFEGPDFVGLVPAISTQN
ncbi:MAG: hypothetical protein Q7R43_05875 [Candidatus Daviesbacteria bacterium]|nr:hypothetical protein [Candidatus Daviesbacteria bacterium]